MQSIRAKLNDVIQDIMPTKVVGDSNTLLNLIHNLQPIDGAIGYTIHLYHSLKIVLPLIELFVTKIISLATTKVFHFHFLL